MCSRGLYRSLEILELVPQLEEFRRSQEDCVEGVNHCGGKLEVFLSQQDVRHGVEDVLRVQEQTELPEGTKKQKFGAVKAETLLTYISL